MHSYHIAPKIEKQKASKAKMDSSGTFIQRLQAVRGLAALSVAGQHTIQAFYPADSMGRWIRAWSNVFYGTGGVLIFFVLSGFVLGLTLTKTTSYNGRTCREFLVRRFLRLYPALLTSLIIYSFYYRFIFVDHFANFFGGRSSTLRISWFDFIANIALLKCTINPVIWSLQVEGMFSILLPLTYFVTDRSLRINLIVFLTLVVVYEYAGWEAFGLNQWSAPWSYLCICYLGWLLAVFRDKLSIAYHSTPKPIVAALVTLAIAVCLTTPHFGAHILPFSLAAAFLIGAISYRVIPAVFAPLDNQGLIYLGNISYSFYLFHPLCLSIILEYVLVMIPSRLVHAHLGVTVLTIGLVSVALAVPVAWLSYYFFERPFTSRKSKVPSNLPDLGRVPAQ